MTEREYKGGYKCRICGEPTGRYFYQCQNLQELIEFVRQKGSKMEEKVKAGKLPGIVWHDLDKGMPICLKCANKHNLNCPECRLSLSMYDNEETGRRKPLAA